jgi:hypothetical protein
MPASIRRLLPLVAVALICPSLASANSPFDPPRLLSQWGHRGSDPGGFSAVSAIAAAYDGSVYVGDVAGRIQKFDRYGAFVTTWSAQGAKGQAGFSPTAIAVARNGTVYVGANDWIQVYDAKGTPLRRFGNVGPYRQRIQGVASIALDAKGNVYAADRGNCRIVKFSAAGKFLGAWGSKGTGPGRFHSLVGIAVGAPGQVYAIDSEAGGVQVFSLEGRYRGAWVRGQGQAPELTVVPGLHRPGEKVQAMLGIVPPLTREMRETFCDSSLVKPVAITADRDGSVYVVNGICDRVQKYTPEGRYVYGWYVAGQPRHAMGLSTGIAAGWREVYVTEFNGPTVRMFSHGLSRAESRVRDIASGDNPLRRLHFLIGAPLGEPRSKGGHTDFPGERYEYLGFGDQPRLHSVSVEVTAVPAYADSISLLKYDPDSISSVQAWLDEAIDEQLGIHGPGPRMDHRRPGLHVRSVARWSSKPLPVAHDVSGPAFPLHDKIFARGESIQMEIVRTSVQFDIADTSADSPDLRLLEGGLTESDGIWELLVSDLQNRTQLARDMIAGTMLPESLLAVVQQTSGPDSVRMSHDLALLAADQWLRSFRMGGTPSSQREPLGPEWERLGFYSARGDGWYDYCGSVLRGLAERVGENRWTDRAFLILLDQGWVTDCSGDFGDDTFGNDLFMPVLAHGDAYLRDHAGGEIWPSVALRVALAHETVWSLSKDRFMNDYYDLRPRAPAHRQRALELYRKLVGMTRDPRMQRGIEKKVRALERDEDTNCRVYYIEGEC